MSEGLSIDAVMAAMARYARASAEEREARDRYEGYSWDYHGGHYIDAVEVSRGAAEKVLKDYISEMVRNQVEEEIRKYMSGEHK